MSLGKFLNSDSLTKIDQAVVTNLIISVLIHPMHYSRVLAVHRDLLNQRKEFKFDHSMFKGVLGSILRRGIYTTTLFVLYSQYFLYK
jgi:hypothetical protein